MIYYYYYFQGGGGVVVIGGDGPSIFRSVRFVSLRCSLLVKEAKVRYHESTWKVNVGVSCSLSLSSPNSD